MTTAPAVAPGNAAPDVDAPVASAAVAGDVQPLAHPDATVEPRLRGRAAALGIDVDGFLADLDGVDLDHFGSHDPVLDLPGITIGGHGHGHDFFDDDDFDLFDHDLFDDHFGFGHSSFFGGGAILISGDAILVSGHGSFGFGHHFGLSHADAIRVEILIRMAENCLDRLEDDFSFARLRICDRILERLAEAIGDFGHFGAFGHGLFGPFGHHGGHVLIGSSGLMSSGHGTHVLVGPAGTMILDGDDALLVAGHGGGFGFPGARHAGATSVLFLAPFGFGFLPLVGGHHGHLHHDDVLFVTSETVDDIVDSRRRLLDALVAVWEVQRELILETIHFHSFIDDHLGFGHHHHHHFHHHASGGFLGHHHPFFGFGGPTILASGDHLLVSSGRSTVLVSDDALLVSGFGHHPTVLASGDHLLVSGGSFHPFFLSGHLCLRGHALFFRPLSFHSFCRFGLFGHHHHHHLLDLPGLTIA